MPEQSSTTSFVPGRCGVVGLGLMGGSFARAFRAAGREVFAWNRTRSTLELAEIETVTGELTDDVIGTCELIILAGYPQSAIDWLREKAGLIADGAIVIDTVGVKRVICETCDKISEGHGWTFVGCHPMAGTQYSGFAHSRATMFKGAPMVVVPPKMADLERADLLERLKKLLAPCQFGSFTLATAGVHDHVIAFTLHVLDNVGSGNAQDSRYVLTDNPTRRKFSDNAEHLRPEVTVVPFSFLLSSHGEGLAGESAGNNVNCS